MVHSLEASNLREIQTLVNNLIWTNEMITTVLSCRLPIKSLYKFHLIIGRITSMLVKRIQKINGLENQSEHMQKS